MVLVAVTRVLSHSNRPICTSLLCFSLPKAACLAGSSRTALFSGTMSSLASLFPVLSRGLNGPAQEVQRTCSLVVDNMCKIVENPSTMIPTMSKFHVCEDEVGVTSLGDGGVLWAHA